MHRKRIEKSLKAKILSESLKEGCVVIHLAKEYGVSKDTIWGSKHKSPPIVSANLKCTTHLHKKCTSKKGH